MPVYTTPESITVDIDLSSGDVRLVAGQRTDTVVEIRPSDETDESDVQAAQQTRVDFADGKLTVRGPKARPFNFGRKTRSVSLLIELPAGSTVHSDVGIGDIDSTGVLGECRIKTSVGQARLERTGPLHLRNLGHVTIGAVDGDADVSSGGRVQIGTISGTAAVKNSNGNTTLGIVAGALRVRAANGDITVERASGGVDAKTSNGSIRIDEVTRDAVTVDTAHGDLEIGVAAGVAAWLDLKTGHGRVHKGLDDIGQAPQPADGTVEIRAHTGFGDITVRRS